MIRQASVWHGKDGYTLRVHDVHALRLAEERAADIVCGASRGYLCPLCLCSRWEWTFGLGYGRDEDGLRRRSLGGFLFHLGQRNRLIGSKLIYERAMAFEEVCEHFPDSRSEDDDDGVTYVRGVMIR